MYKSIIEKFFAKKASPQEIRKVVDWFFGKEAEREFDRDLNKELKSNITQDPAFDREKHFEKVLAQIPEQDIAQPQDLASSWLKVAAAVLLVCLSALAISYWNAPAQQHQQVSVRQVTKSTEKGQKLTTYLPDGSKVILNSGSKITYQLPFETTERRVYMEGEVFFEVVKNAELPFKVVSAEVTTTALGTSFNIDCRNPQKPKVALVTGKVRVEKESLIPVTLTPGKSVTLNDQGGLVVGDFEYLDVVSWKDGTLYFDKAGLNQIVKKLEQWYGVDIQVSAGLEDEFHYSGIFREKSLEEVLRGVSFVHQFDYRINGNNVEIYPKTN